MKTFELGGRTVGGDAPVFLIAELSANHGQNKDIALRTIEAAAKAGADAIKLQTYTPDTLTLKSDAPWFVVKTKNAWAGRTLHDLYQEAMTPWEWHAELKAAAESFGLQCFSTPFDPTAVAFLEDLNVPAHKVASFELNDLPLVECVARTGKPVIMSTGMASLADIDAAVALCREAGNDKIALLRCVSSYPAKPESMALSSFEVLRGFETVVGLSDHTRDATVAVASVALGAKLIEKHFILDRSVGGPDSFFSLEPAEFSAMVKAVRDTEKALGRPRFGPSEDERASTAFRRSLFVAKDVKAGEVLTCDVVRSVRPVNGLAPRFLPQVLGRRAARDLAAGTPLAWDMVGAAIEPTLALRPATADDGPALLAWRNDATTRAMSLQTDVVTEEAHRAWLARSLAATDRVLSIAVVGATAVGTVRLDRGEHDSWEISLTVAPSERGKGHAAAMLRAAERLAVERGALRLTAVLKKENAASLRAFQTAGYYGFFERSGLLHGERRLLPFR
jgi:pseudaminic acid synthase